MINITTNQLAEILEKDSTINLYDLRTPIEFASGHIPDSHNLPFEELKYFNDPKMRPTTLFVGQETFLTMYAKF